MVFDAYLDQRTLIPPGRIVDLAYHDLEARPLDVMREIYEKLGLPGFEAARLGFEAYLGALKT